MQEWTHMFVLRDITKKLWRFGRFVKRCEDTCFFSVQVQARASHREHTWPTFQLAARDRLHVVQVLPGDIATDVVQAHQEVRAVQHAGAAAHLGGVPPHQLREVVRARHGWQGSGAWPD